MKLVTAGQNRDCWLIGRWAIKTPTLRNGLRSFLMGWLGNIEENLRWKESQHPQLAPVLHSWFGGFVNIYPRYKNILNRGLSHEELKALPIYNPDPKRENYAEENGQIIVLDYGHFDAWPK